MAKLELGGAQKVLLDYARRLPYMNYIISGSGGILFEEAERTHNHFVIEELKREILPLYDLIAVKKVRALLRAFLNKFDYTFLHTHGSKAGIIGRLASANLSRRLIVFHTVHGFAITPFKPVLENFIYVNAERIAAGFCDKIIFPAKNLITKARKWRIGKESQYIYIPYGIIVPEKVKKERGNRIRIGTVGNFKPQKNPLVWAFVAKELVRKFRNVEFHYLGDGVLRSKVEEIIGNSPRIYLHGWLKNSYRWYKKFDVYFLPSRWEGLPLTILEAMAHKLPVVSSNVDGNTEVVINDLTGYSCSPDNIECYIYYLSKLINNDKKREKMGENGREVVRENFSRSKMIKNTSNLYRTFLSEL